MAEFVQSEELNSRATIVKQLGKREYSLVDQGEGRQSLSRNEVYVVKYEANALVAHWLDSYIWVSVGRSYCSL